MRIEQERGREAEDKRRDEKIKDKLEKRTGRE